MAATIAAAPEAERRAWADRLQVWSERSGGSPASLRDASAPVFAALERLRSGEALSTDEAVAALGSVCDPRVRDMMLARREPGAEQLWTLLLRHAPNAEVEAPAVLLAIASQLNGDGVMAKLALERAQDAVAPRPPSALVRMLDQMLMLEPQCLRELLDGLTEAPEGESF